MKSRLGLRLPLLLCVAACTGAPPFPNATTNASGTPPGTAVSVASFSPSNPFASRSTLPFEAPPFDRIHDGDYAPAIEEGMRRQLAEIAAIADDPAPPTFDNTIVPMERSGELLTRVWKVFSNITQMNTNDTLQKVKAELAPRLAAHQDAISLNPRLFARVQAVYDGRDALPPEEKYLVERTYRHLVRDGAKLSDSEKAALTRLNQEESTLTTEYSDKILADTNASAVVVENRAQLDGLSEGDLAAAAEAAKDKGLAGKWMLALQNTTQQPPLQSLRNRSLRARLFEASVRRGNHGGENDTRAIIQRLAAERPERAKLLGFPSFAAYVLDDQMAKTPENALRLMTGLVPASTAKAREEAARIQREIDGDNDKGSGGFALQPYDWDFYADRVRKAEFDLDESQIRPYLELDRVLRDGVFFAANRLYGITFRERTDIPVYNPDVRVFEVLDADGKPLALYYGDYYARPSKQGGAWQDSFVDQSGLLDTKPAVINVLNFTKPAPGQKCLLSFGEVTGLFHEFGHALHAMFANVRYPTLSNVPRDFVEFPSQINEHWALEPTVFANYAKHYQTGAPMPPALVEKIKKSKTFNQGYATTEYLASALLDIAWHELPAGAPAPDVDAFERAALQRFRIDLPQVPPRYHTTYFSHIWQGDYAAGYYAYLWSELIDDDAYYWFRENGGMTRANGQRFRDMILSRGGTQDVAAMYRAFRGRDPIVEPLLEERGLTSPPKSQR
jgi:peptidyl-dipeptidase Dcp